MQIFVHCAEGIIGDSRTGHPQPSLLFARGSSICQTAQSFCFMQIFLPFPDVEKSLRVRILLAFFFPLHSS
jgi:hypothetical protein